MRPQLIGLKIIHEYSGFGRNLKITLALEGSILTASRRPLRQTMRNPLYQLPLLRRSYDLMFLSMNKS